MMLLDKQHFEKIIHGKDPVLVDFYADWCGPCKMLGPVLEDLSKDSDFAGKLQFAKLDTEAFPEIAQDNGVQGIPCMILFRNGKEVSRIVGFAPKQTLKTKILSLIDAS